MTPFSGVDLHGLSLVVSERVIACLIAGSVLTAAAGLALRLMSRQRARAKFALCFTTLTGVALFPIYGWWQAQSVASSVSATAPVIRLPEAWATYICLIWAIGAALGLARVVYGLYRVGCVRNSCVPVEATTIDASLQKTLADFQSVRSVQLCTSELVRVPTAIGFWRPVIALPEWCVGDLSPVELHSVVLHELEHLRRYDDWTNLFQRVVGVVFFFHPAIWWLESRLSLEREMACDDAVLNVVPDPKTYARCLVSLAGKSYLRRGIALAQAAVSRVQQLTARVTQILDVRRPTATPIWKPVLSVVMVTVFAGSASLELAPRLVAFQNDAAGKNSIDMARVDGMAGQAVSDNHQGSALTRPTMASTGGEVQPQIAAYLGSQHPAFELRPTPARWVEPAPSLKLAPKPARNHSRRSSLIADKLANLKAAKEAGGVTQRASNDVSGSNAVSSRAGFDPELAALNAAFALRSSQADGPGVPTSPSQMLVMVVHTEERDSSGVMFWSVRVVRLMIFHSQPQQRAADAQVPTKT